MALAELIFSMRIDKFSNDGMALSYENKSCRSSPYKVGKSVHEAQFTRTSQVTSLVIIYN